MLDMAAAFVDSSSTTASCVSRRPFPSLKDFIPPISNPFHKMSALDGSQLNGPLVVFLVVLGAAATVVVACAVHHLFYLAEIDSQNSLKSPSKS
jgi:hypothetical protein